MKLSNEELNLFAMSLIIVLILFIYMKSNRPESYNI